VSPADEAVDVKPQTDAQRLDKWLWFARVVRSRTNAAALVTEGKVRVNGARVEKPAHSVRAGDAVTIMLREQVRVLKVKAFALRRGGAEAAAALFDDLTAPKPNADEAATITAEKDGLRAPGSGRPTKRDRRLIDRFKAGST
jgi:ribosome-associated heat shock protein Hsp15